MTVPGCTIFDSACMPTARSGCRMRINRRVSLGTSGTYSRLGAPTASEATPPRLRRRPATAATGSRRRPVPMSRRLTAEPSAGPGDPVGPVSFPPEPGKHVNRRAMFCRGLDRATARRSLRSNAPRPRRSSGSSALRSAVGAFAQPSLAATSAPLCETSAATSQPAGRRSRAAAMPRPASNVRSRRGEEVHGRQAGAD
jgi:hypothetical protein